MWNLLKIEPTTDLKAIRKAYAIELRKINPQEQAEEFQQLKSAFDRASAWAKQQKNSETLPRNFPEKEAFPKEEKSESSDAEDWTLSESSFSLSQSEVSSSWSLSESPRVSVLEEVDNWSLSESSFSLSQSEASSSWSLSESPRVSVLEEVDNWTLPEVDEEEKNDDFIKEANKKKKQAKRKRTFYFFLIWIAFVTIYVRLESFSDTDSGKSKETGTSISSDLRVTLPSFSVPKSSYTDSNYAKLVAAPWLGIDAPEMIRKKLELSEADFQIYLQGLTSHDAIIPNVKGFHTKLGTAPPFFITDVSLGEMAEDEYVYFSELSDGSLVGPIIVENQIVAYFYLSKDAESFDFYSKIWKDDEAVLSDIEKQYQEGTITKVEKELE